MRGFAAFLIAALGAATAQAEYAELDASDGGSIAGAVSFKGALPPIKQMSVNKDPDVCGAAPRIVDTVDVDGAGGLLDVVVHLEKITAGKAWPAIAGFVLEQKDCRFFPSSRVMRRGETLRILNKDKVFHNIHAYELIGRVRKTMFNHGQPLGSEIPQKLKPKRAEAVKLECDIHDFMHSHILVLEHPYFSQTIEDGNYVIEGIPPGKYQLVAWHPVLGEKRASVDVVSGGRVSINFVFEAP